jgi:mycothiol synthase
VEGGTALNPSGRPRHPWLKQEFEHQLEMVRPAPPTSFVDVPSLPQGYALRQFRAGDEKRYDDLFHLAFEDEGRFGEILDRALNEGFFVVEDLASSELVSSCVALRGSSSPRHAEAGQLGWLVTDPSHCGKGLGTVVAAAVTNRLAVEGYLRPFLGTEDCRFAAISIYLKLGWRPYIYRGEMEGRWRNIMARLDDRISETCFVY